MNIKYFGEVNAGETVYEAEIKNKGSLRASVISYGAIIRSLRFVCPDGIEREMILGYESFDEVIKGNVNAKVIGRVANRIAGGAFELDHTIYKLDKNEGNNTLHSGMGNYATKNFTIVDTSPSSVTLVYIDHGEGGFPGKVNVEVTYEITDKDELSISYMAVPTKKTPINLTNHCYFNISGGLENTVLNQKLKLYSRFYTPLNEEKIPTGELLKTEGTALDFSDYRLLSDVIKDGFGFDHNVLIDGHGFRKAAKIVSMSLGVKMIVMTDQSAMQIFSANQLPTVDHLYGKFIKYSGICFETQDTPNLINMDPSTAIDAGSVYLSRTTYGFSTN